MDTVVKHGSHDQKSHGRGGGAREVSAKDVDSAWDAVLTDEARAIDNPKKAHPEKYDSKGKLKDGEVETRRVQGEGPPRVRDYETNESAGLSWSEAAKVEGALGLSQTGDFTMRVPIGPERPPQHVYRVMSTEEFDQARQRGYIKSDERMNLASGEGTVTSLRSTGDFYAPVDGSDYRVVRIKYDDADGWRTDTIDSYIKTQERVPFDRVDLYSSPLTNPRVTKHGSHDQSAHGRKGGTGRAEPVRSMSEMPPNIRRVAESFDAPTWSRFRDSCDRGGGCEDVAAAIEERFGVPQVTGTFTTKSGAKEYHSWNQDASGWIVDGGQDVFPSGQGDGSALMFFAPGASQYAVDSVAKHGSHNQASHNPHKGGAKDLPEGWSERSREAVRERQMSRFSQHYEDPSRVQEIADRVTDRTREFDGPNGTVVRVQFSDAAQQVDPAKMNEALGAIDTVQKLNPVKDLVVHFGDQPFRDEAAIIDGGALGFVIRGEKTINMRPGLVEKGVVTERPDSGHFMPSYEAASPLTYYITHEYGHVLDRRSSGQQDDYALFQSGAINSVSEYGRTNGAETWAESYTEWALTGGRTSNPASQYFADKYFWADNLSEAAVKAVGERTIIVDTFSVLKDPEIITTVAKAVYVAFEPGLRPVLKHGSHDQSSHGRRGGGGSSLTLDAGVAQSIVERVRANGGLSVSMVDGSEPTGGFMVAKGGKQSAIVDADEFYDPVKGPAAMSSFLKENRELGEGSYLGLWHNQADGKVYFDVSENIMDRATAIQAGRDRDQISIWDVANLEEINTGGTGAVGKAVAGSETAGPVQDDGSGDRRIRKESVGEGGGAVVIFEPGLRPVLKHGSHNQSSHGRRGGGGGRKYAPAGTGLTRDVEAQQDAMARALMNNDFSGLDIGSSRLAMRIGNAEAAVIKRIESIAARVGIKRKQRWKYTADEASSLRDSYYERYGKPSWMGKAFKIIRKHLGGAHDQKAHGRGKGGGESGWGERQKEIDAMASAGPSRDALEGGVSGGMSDDEVRERISEDFAESIEEDARLYVEEQMASEGWVDNSDDPDYEEPLIGKTYQEEFDERLEGVREEVTDSYVDGYGEEYRNQATEDLGLDADAFNEVYGTSHTGITPDGREITLQASVENVYINRWDESIDVDGTIYDTDGNWAGEFQRKFFRDESGDMVVEHALLRIEDDYQGTGFSKVFNRTAENYYISHGVNKVDIHAALDVGGYAWAKQGFDWAPKGGATWQVKDQFDNVLSDPGLPASVRRSGASLRARLDLPSSDPDYPTPREVASWGYVQGASTWPGKQTLLGSDWYGQKSLTPSGPRQSTTEQEAGGQSAAAQVPGQMEIPGVVS